MVFFLNAEAKVYGRYGGRDGKNADDRQSLAGLLATMKSVLAMHEQADKSYAPKSQETPKYLRDQPGARFRGRGCIHCHNVKEMLQESLEKAGKWTRDMVYRYPLPENLGIELDVDRSNVIRTIKDGSPAAAVGLKPNDVLRRLNGVPVHSFADAQYALDRAPKSGTIDIAWQQGEKLREEKLALTEGWRKTDISWRPSVRYLVPYAGVYGNDLTADEKKTLGLTPTQMAFRQKQNLSRQAQEAGVQAGDIIVGIDDRTLETNVDGFLRHVQQNYLIGDRATLNILRDGKPLKLTMKFIP